MRITPYLLWSLLGLASEAHAAELTPFTTDGCSSFPDGTVEHHALWFGCCLSHDLAYWKGGAEGERQQADAELAQCVASLGEPDIARLMHLGVYVGGTPHLPTPFRWGYGWPFARGYKALDEGERRQVQQRLQEFRTLVQEVTRKGEAGLGLDGAQE